VNATNAKGVNRGVAPVTESRGVNRGVAPVTYGTGSRPPRGDYGRARSDYTCEQDHARYTAADHDTYRRLHARQLLQLPGLACDAFIAAVDHLGPPDQIPRFDTVSEKLMRATGWQIVAVPGLIPEEAFFALLAQRRFPVTDWIRKPEEFDYVVEPDVFHDLCSAMCPCSLCRRLRTTCRPTAPVGSRPAGWMPASCWRGCTGTRWNSA
jgi:hypothetical protein